MATLSQAKTLGSVGSILVLLTAVPSVGALLGILGFILILVAIKNISDVVADRSIFNNMLVAVGLAIAGIVVGALVVVGIVLRFVGLNNLNLGPNFNASTVPAGDWVGLIGSILLGLAVVWVILLVSAVYVRRSYGEIASKLKVGMFGTAGLLYLIGAATTIILVGFFLLFVSQILLIVAFFSIPNELPSMATGGGTPGSMAAPPPSMAPPGGATKFCVNCGNKIAATATFCNSCGAKQP
jgi:uncharacterized membrane protein